MSSQGLAVCKNCGYSIEQDFLVLVKKVTAGLGCPECGHQIGKVDNLKAREQLRRNSNDQ